MSLVKAHFYDVDFRPVCLLRVLLHPSIMPSRHRPALDLHLHQPLEPAVDWNNGAAMSLPPAWDMLPEHRS